MQYEFYTGTPQWPLGWGLSYTTWQLTWLSDAEEGGGGGRRSVDAAAWLAGAAPAPAWGVNVTNTGAVTSDVSVLAFLSSGYAGAPLQQVCGWRRVVIDGHTIGKEGGLSGRRLLARLSPSASPSTGL